VSCSTGSATIQIPIPGNQTPNDKAYTLRLTATGKGKAADANPVSVTVAAPLPPSISSFTATPQTLPPIGGTVSVVASVTDAASCKFSSSPALPGLPSTVSCSTGTANLPISLPANPTAKVKTYRFRLAVTGIGKVARVGPVSVTVAAPPPPAVLSFVASPAALGSAGGHVDLQAVVAGGTSCTFKASPAVTGLPKTTACGSGAASASITLPANATKKSKTFTFTVTASGVGPDARSQPAAVTVAAAGTTDTTPPGPVSGLSATSATTGIQLLWTDPGDSDLAAVTIRRASGSTPPSSATDGTLVATVPSPDHAFSDTTVANSGATYSYTLFAVDAAGNTSAGTSVTVQSLDITPPGPVTDLTASASTDGIHLAWSNPTDSDFAGVVIRRLDGSTAPTSPTDGAPVATTDANTATFDDSDAAPGSTYTYALFALDETGNHAVAMTITYALPTAAEQHVCGSLTSDTTWSPSRAAVYVIDCAVTVPAGVTLHVAAGTIIKVAANTGIGVQSGGSLQVAGSAASPVVFTSLSDDSAGGDTNDDGGSAPSVSSAVAVFVFGGGSVSVAFGDFRYLTYGLADNGAGGGSCSGSTGAAEPAVSVIDSTFESLVWLGCGETPTFARDVFGQRLGVAGDHGAYMVLSGGGDPSGVVMAGTDEVRFTDPAGQALFLDGEDLPAGKSWTVSGSTGGVIVSGNGGNSNCGFSVDGTLTLTAGAIVKVGCNTGIGVQSGGSLQVAGSAASPVVFTSLSDDSAGGDTNDDGASTGSAGGYSLALNIDNRASLSGDNLKIRDGATAIRQVGGTIILSNATITDEGLGLDSTGGTAGYRGAFLNVSTGIEACSWTAGCFVDARQTNWGSPDGPFPASGALACGAVLVRPWLPDTGDQSPFTGECSGNPPPDQQALTSAGTFDSIVASLCTDPTEADACAAASTQRRCYAAAVNLAASQSPVPLPAANAGETALGYSNDALGILTNAYSDLPVTATPDATQLGQTASGALGIVSTILALKAAADGCH
jgi:hypothetical protein